MDVRVHIVPQIGDVKLQALSPADVQKMYAELLKGSAAKTVHNVGGTLGKALEDAVSGLIQRNVARLVDRPSPVEVEMEAWTAEQLRASLAPVTPRVGDLVRLAATSRTGRPRRKPP